MRQFFALTTLCLSLSALTPAAFAGEKVWISLGDAAYAKLLKHRPAVRSVASVLSAPSEDQSLSTAVAPEGIHLVQVDEEVLASLSHSIHEELRRCGGYMYHSTEAAGRASLTRHSLPASARSVAAAAVAVTRPSYVIDQQAVVTPILSQMQASNIGQTIVDLSGYTNRYYTSSSGVNASNWLRQRWLTLAGGRSDITVEQFTHAGWAQKSVIATIKGTDNGSEVIVLGAHLDSINQSGGSAETMRAPGADDDASGVASLTEVLRALVSANYKPRRTIKLMAYAAEEVGLRGSQEIAASYAAANTNVVGVMQLDMTNYKGAANDIYIFTDYTDSLQNQFLTSLIQTYLPTLKIGSDRCGYGCSDHASWNAQGYYASLPFEASFSADNPYIHTANDTYANMGSQADHSLKFARLAAAYAVELGSDGPGTAPADRTENFSGSLTRNQTRSFGPFKVAAGGSLTASTTGTGDIDLYARRSAVPTTTTYTCKSDGSSSTEACTVSMTTAGDVYVLLSGYAAGNYQLKVVYKPQ
ncbi:M20/M25/M40 family metallo-hydrolase [Roseateles amylovorans]|uniref:M20/M25/M40 family metallo-hydrolase n=1 Tax=Roseateles amylovorans TaxID=2978473 RepID=A0ABY6AW32_9BURK|nr:M20/M25/M40 family metallo-hydrolase [Roseateles amylovorans]UXH76528.1 M20/M25/M40 family metallo-hydrolase [Roseateles amylovorans]